MYEPLTPDGEIALREGLRALPVPALSPDFDARVLAALCAGPSPWQMFLQSLRPALGGLACSLVVMLGLIYGATRAPVGAPDVTAAASPRTTISAAVIERALDSPNLRADTLRRLWAAQTPPAALDPRSGQKRSSLPSRRTASSERTV